MVRLLAIDLDGRDAELVADRCWQAGAAGIWEVDASTLRAGVDDDDVTSFLTALADLGPVDVTDVEAVELAGRGVSLDIAGQHVALWVPATVFGDGTHPTTATCLELVEAVAGRGDDVLDVGCGTGALTIAAALHGARVTAIDIDPEAAQATADNAARNGVTVAATTTPLAEVTGTFDLVVANMTVGSLGPLVPDLVRCTRPGGTIVVSGLLEDQWPGVEADLGGEVTTVRVVDGWVSAAVVVGGSTAEAP